MDLTNNVELANQIAESDMSEAKHKPMQCRVVSLKFCIIACFFCFAVFNLILTHISDLLTNENMSTWMRHLQDMLQNRTT